MKINQADNFRANFGEVLRSSAIFWYKKGPDIRTTCSVFNYWPLKRNVRVAVLYSLRTMSGELVERARVNFDESSVIHLRPGPESFEGSIEIEVFSLTNLVIPYAAVMGVYESARTTSVVHSYSRVYSSHEIEEGRTICEGEEGCWTVRDAETVRSFGVLHNGASACGPQRARLSVQRADGQRLSADLDLPALRPFETLRLEPADHLPHLAAFLGGQPGNASLSFRTSGSFTRLLIGNVGPDDVQVTHSNFNYAHHQTDLVEVAQQEAYMPLPALRGRTCEVVVYPERLPGRYEIEHEGRTHTFDGDGIMVVPLGEQKAPGNLIFRRLDAAFPSRLVTGLRVSNGPALPAECSLGVIHHLQPPKRFWWGLCGREVDRCRLLACDLDVIYDHGKVSDKSLEVSLFSSAHLAPLRRRLDDPTALLAGMSLTELFPEAASFLAGDMGWWTLGSPYGGLNIFSTFETSDGRLSLEHGF